MVEATPRVVRAIQLFNSGCNCAQAVFAAFADVVGIEENQCLRISSAFGGGMCGTRGVCGAVTGMLMAVGAAVGYDVPTDAGQKQRHYELCRTLMERFNAEFGSICCSELTCTLKNNPKLTKLAGGMEAKRPCAALVAYAASLAEEAVCKKTDCQH